MRFTGRRLHKPPRVRAFSPKRSAIATVAASVLHVPHVAEALNPLKTPSKPGSTSRPWFQGAQPTFKRRGPRGFQFTRGARGEVCFLSFLSFLSFF